VKIIPSIGVDAAEIIRSLKDYVDESEIKKYVKIADRTGSEVSSIIFDIQRLVKNYDAWIREGDNLRKKLSGRPILKYFGLDTLEAIFSEVELKRIISLEASITRNEGDLSFFVAKPGIEKVTQRVRNISTIHLKLTRRYGVILLYGIKPGTGLYAVETEVSGGYPTARLKPIV
jgi:hypothetical protein